jgi:predicted permease
MQVLGQYILPLLLVALGVSMIWKKKKKDDPNP